MIIRSRAPLRIGIAGGGTDVSPFCDEYGGYVLNATINKYAYCTIEERCDGKIVFSAPDRNERVEYDSEPSLPFDGQLDLHKAVYNRIVGQFQDGQPLSFHMTTYCDAPAGSGLGSSSTLVVSMVKAYTEWLNLPLGEYDNAHLAYEIERMDAGLEGGRQDQYAAAFGGFNFMEFYKQDKVIVNPLRIKNWIINELEQSMILFYTGVSRSSGQIIQEQAANAKQKNKQSLDAMHELKADALVIKECILKGDIRLFAEFLDKSWNAKKKMAASVSNSHIDSIYNAAKAAGAYAGKVSGAGGGGFMIFIVNPVRRLEVLRALAGFNGQVMDVHFTKWGTQGWRV
ncbi:dehydrogenase [Paenibacillus thalictri]|uniref:Dehydrogenase n=1 Tax=Paenibacillus thalictri TaxID=2527873 RepID=A0A4Q9DXA7_9BACL|nr:dehydrogenase [Paenibacillus thalictri]TBL81754.1 dehydrogenase [Paenibacillus thalictri]